MNQMVSGKCSMRHGSHVVRRGKYPTTISRASLASCALVVTWACGNSEYLVSQSWAMAAASSVLAADGVDGVVMVIMCGCQAV